MFTLYIPPMQWGLFQSVTLKTISRYDKENKLSLWLYSYVSTYDLLQIFFHLQLPLEISAKLLKS